MKTLLFTILCLALCTLGGAQMAGTPGKNALTIAKDGKTHAIIVVTPEAGQCRFAPVNRNAIPLHQLRQHQAFPGSCLESPTVWEGQAAQDLARAIALMTGARPAIADTPQGIADALQQRTVPVFVIGAQALAANPRLQDRLNTTAAKTPILRADAILLQRQGNRVYLLGTNDESHYYAVAELLKRWGCRWYLPTEFGECIPEYNTLQIGTLDYAYAPPFEVRRAWLSWSGSGEGWMPFTRRNNMNDLYVPSMHILGNYLKALVPPGKKVVNVPIADDATAEAVAKQVADKYAKGEYFSLGMDDAVYNSDSELDTRLKANIWDKYFMLPSQTEAFMVFYNKVAKILRTQYPDSAAKIGFLWYTNNTIPPQRDVVAEQSLIGYLAPIDIDPIHGMDDPRSLPRQEFKEMVYRWAEIMQGRLVIYDYDQSMLVWRDIPNPSIQNIRQDIRHYRKAGVLGIDVESRGAFATTFLNLYLRAELAWNPDADVDALLADFYPRFYGPAAAPMAQYWTAINKAWADTIVTEHEFFVAPAIYTPQLLAELRGYLEAAEKAIAPLAQQAQLTRNDQRYVERMRFTRESFAVLDNYIAMTLAAARDCDYRAAVEAGQRGLAAREALGKMNPTFTTTKLEGTWGWWPGDVLQNQDWLACTDGTKGTLVAKLPLAWAFRRDPHDTGLVSGWARKPIDLTYWQALPTRDTIAGHMQNPGQWEMLRTDLYMQAQGVLHPDYANYNGYSWYRTETDLSREAAAAPVHLRFPGLFGECWLYINGNMVAYRPQHVMWWNNDYRFEWDVDLTGAVQPGVNTITLRVNSQHHVGGIFRRPFLYRPIP